MMTTYILGFVNAMNIGELDDFSLHRLELRLAWTSLHESRILEQHG
jgi:hypothetical protein